MKPIAKQLIIAALVLTLVTVLSLVIREVRFSLYRANTLESPVVAHIEPDPDPAGSHLVETDPEPEYAEVTEPDEEEPSKDYSEAKPSKGDYAKAKSFKKDFAKTKGSKGLEQMSLSDNENLFRTKNGELWYVSKQPDGKTEKMLVHIDEMTGEMIFVDAKSGGSQNLQKISLGNNENLYITEEGEQWYVTPDSKSQVEIDDTSGEITVLEEYGGDNQSAGKD